MSKLTKKYSGIIWDIYQEPVKMPDGSTRTFEYARRKYHSVSVFAFNEKKQLLLIHEWRRHANGYQWFIPAGRMDKETNPRRAANRELQEESGYKAKNLKIYDIQEGGNSLQWKIYFYIATSLSPSRLKGDIDEDIIETKFVSLRKALQMAKNKEICNSHICSAIVWLAEDVRKGKVKI